MELTTDTNLSHLTVGDLSAVFKHALKVSLKDIMKPDEYISEKEALLLINRTSPKSLYRLRLKGEIKSNGGTRGKPIEYQKESIINYLRKNTH